MRTSTEDLLTSFSKLKLVDMSDCSRNSPNAPQTLKGCEGYLRRLPLCPPNVDPMKPKTIEDMVNILTIPTAAAEFEEWEASLSEAAQLARLEGKPSPIYDYVGSEVMQRQLRTARNHISHVKGFGIFGHVVKPGCLSFYKRDENIYAGTSLERVETVVCHLSPANIVHRFPIRKSIGRPLVP
jgi:hypothetical protein